MQREKHFCGVPVRDSLAWVFGATQKCPHSRAITTKVAARF